MHFGRNETGLTNFDYHLPADPELTTATLQSVQPAAQVEAFVGARKWGYKNWLGKLYPGETKDADFLSIYAAHFNTVELSTTFYQPQPPERMYARKQMV